MDVAIAVVVEFGSGVRDETGTGMILCPLQEVRIMRTATESRNTFFMSLFCKEPANGLRYAPALFAGDRVHAVLGSALRRHLAQLPGDGGNPAPFHKICPCGFHP